MPRIKIEVDGFRCARCGHEWVPRKDEQPRVCPRCKSPFWDRERQLVGFRAEAILRGEGASQPTKDQLQRLERRLDASRHPAVRRSGRSTRVGIHVRAATESNARVTARRIVTAAAEAVGLRRPDFACEVRSVRRTE